MIIIAIRREIFTPIVVTYNYKFIINFGLAIELTHGYCSIAEQPGTCKVEVKRKVVYCGNNSSW